MFSAKVWASDPLYSTLNRFFATSAPHRIVVSSRTDYRDPSCIKTSLDFGSFNIHLKDDPKLQVAVLHERPTETQDASLTLTSDRPDQNMQVIETAIKAMMRNADQRVVGVYSWESGWHQRQAAFVVDHSLSHSQQRLMAAIDSFYKNGAFYKEHNLPFQNGIVVSGASCSGKHYIVRYAALRHQKQICYLPVTEATYASIGPAIACAPLNSIIVIDGLLQFYTHIPSSERAVFLRHLESVFNTAVCDPHGLLVILIAPSMIPPELERFLLMPHRFQKRFDLSLAGEDQIKLLFTKRLGDLPTSEVERLSRKAIQVGAPMNVLQWFFAGHHKEGTSDPKSLLPLLDDLLAKVKDERNTIDMAQPGQAHRERMYC